MRVCFVIVWADHESERPHLLGDFLLMLSLPLASLLSLPPRLIAGTSEILHQVIDRQQTIRGDRNFHFGVDGDCAEEAASPECWRHFEV
jgi:hypothetical protein